MSLNGWIYCNNVTVIKKKYMPKMLHKRKYKEINVHEFNCFPLFTFFLLFLEYDHDDWINDSVRISHKYIVCSIIYYKSWFCIVFFSNFCFWNSTPLFTSRNIVALLTFLSSSSNYRYFSLFQINYFTESYFKCDKNYFCVYFFSIFHFFSHLFAISSINMFIMNLFI